MVWNGTMTPRSMTSKLLHCRTTPTMFLPISCTSPLTVAMTIRPLVCAPSDFSASMNGNRWATAFFITRADFTTCGRNIFPAPNRSPTMFMPAINGPSITSIGRLASSLASSVSATTSASRPLTRACASRFSTGQPRHSAAILSSTGVVPLYRSARATSRSVASSRRLRITSSQASRSSGSMAS